MPLPFANSHWIEPGRILAGEYPGGDTRAETAQRLSALLEAGVTYFIDLTGADELPPYERQLPKGRDGGRRAIVHVRHAISDHGLPATPEFISEILDDIHQALEAGHTVYIHCRAGIGRTNLVAACWLRRKGLTPKRALEQLNQLWQANERSARWQRVPEGNQERYFLKWVEQPSVVQSAAVQPPVRAVPMPRAARFMGVLFGMLCGDAMGAALEGSKPDRSKALTGMPANAVWSDDSAMCLCLAQSLLDRNGFDARDQLTRYLGWQRDGDWTSQARCTGIRATVAKALATAQWSPNPFVGSHDPERWEAEALSRVAAVVLFSADNPAQAIGWAAEQARITHQSPGVLDCCRYFASLLLTALEGRPKREWRVRARALLKLHYGKALKPEVARLVEAKRWPNELGADEPRACIVALRTLLWALNGNTDFASGLLKVVNCGGNSDVHGTLFGQLAGAYYGADAIPKDWRSRLSGVERVEAIGDRMLARVP